MKFEYYKTKPHVPFVEAFYELEITKEDLPYESLVIPKGTCNIFKIYSRQPHIAHCNNEDIKFKGLIANGPIYGAYKIDIPDESYSLGVTLSPTALFQLTGVEMTSIFNKFENLQEFCPILFDAFNSIFENYKHDFSGFKDAVNECLNTLSKKNENPRIQDVNEALMIIHQHEGLIKINEILEKIPVSRKTLENQFKKMVGITIGRYIRQYRFLSLISKYKTNKIDYYEMMYKYNYYDASHFIKDFHFFTLQSPKDYFKKDFPLLEKYLFK